jgi:hypothetical protein
VLTNGDWGEQASAPSDLGMNSLGRREGAAATEGTSRRQTRRGCACAAWRDLPLGGRQVFEDGGDRGDGGFVAGEEDALGHSRPPFDAGLDLRGDAVRGTVVRADDGDRAARLPRSGRPSPSHIFAIKGNDPVT